MHVVYAQEKPPESYSKSIFLVGPTPRDQNTPSWRPAMLEALAKTGYDGVVFYPEPRNGSDWAYYATEQMEWEKKYLEMADVILAWVPRNLKDMPAFTTNVEFGEWVRSGKLIYGRPDDSQKNQYLDWKYKDHTNNNPFNSVQDIANAVAVRLGNGSLRTLGEREIPLHIWETAMFQKWYEPHKSAGNILNGAKILWTFIVGKDLVFAYSLQVKMWIKSESRYKDNEFVLARNDITCVIPYGKSKTGDVLDTKVVLVREFRSPVRNPSCMVLELPGGSDLNTTLFAFEVALSELKDEIGLVVDLSRLEFCGKRPMVSTFASQHAYLFKVALDDTEIEQIEFKSQRGVPMGVLKDTERTYVVVKTLREIFLTQDMDWSMMGMLLSGLN